MVFRNTRVPELKEPGGVQVPIHKGSWNADCHTDASFLIGNGVGFPFKLPHFFIGFENSHNHVVHANEVGYHDIMVGLVG